MIRRAWALAVLFCFFSLTLSAYSVLTHEAIIDSAWEKSIKPLLLAKYPNATKDDLIKAHAYAYGGAILQDMGYYPFGSHFFSDLVHYVRSGDFVLNMLSEAQNLDEYAFALGTLSHYCADNDGHPIATNRTVPLLYPKLREEFGNVITYEDDPAAHLKTEFGFDVVQVAHGHFAPQNYHDFIGFEVAKPVLERAFQKTYGIPLHTVFLNEDLALGTYRHTVGSIIPEMTKVAWQMDKDQLQKATPGLTRRKFVYHLSRSSYEKEWGRKYDKPGIGARILAFFLRLVPKVGPFKALSFRPPNREGERLFMQSFNTTVESFERRVAALRQGDLKLTNDNFDTGQPTRPGAYRMADDAYAKIVGKLAEHDFAEVTPELRANILQFYSDPNAPYHTKEKPKDWEKLTAQVAELRKAGPAVGQ